MVWERCWVLVRDFGLRGVAVRRHKLSVPVATRFGSLRSSAHPPLNGKHSSFSLSLLAVRRKSMQPLKQPPKVFQILAKTHRLTVFLNAPHPTTVAALKTQALAALVQFSDAGENVPKVRTVDDFEFCRATKQKGIIVAFDVLENKSIVRETLSNWEVIYFRFRNENGLSD